MTGLLVLDTDLHPVSPHIGGKLLPDGGSLALATLCFTPEPASRFVVMRWGVVARRGDPPPE